jgi:hypothetical protein
VADAATDWTTAGQAYVPPQPGDQVQQRQSADVGGRRDKFWRLKNIKGPPSSLADAIDTIDTPDRRRS